MLAGLGGDRDLSRSEASLHIAQGLIDETLEVLIAKWLQSENLRPADQGTVDVKKRIVCGGADKAQGSALQMGQKNVLLRLVKTVNLIHEQNRGLAVQAQVLRGHLGLFTDVGNRALHAAVGDKS